MDDLRARFASLEAVRVPDLWPEIERRAALPSMRVVAAPPRLRKVPGRGVAVKPPARSWRWALLIAAVLAIALIGAAIMIGSGRLQPIVLPVPSIAARLALPTASLTLPSPSPTVATPLGGRLIVTHAFAAPSDRSDREVYALDAATGETVVLGTLPGPNRGGYPYAYAFERDVTGAHTLALAGWPTDLVDLQSPTDASLPFGFISRGAIKATGSLFVLSPRGDLIATADDADNTTRIRVFHVDGRPATELRLPAGVKGGWPWSWSPDESAILATGCRPCNKAQTPVGPQTATHSHLYVVPVDGSPWRELLDEDNATILGSSSPTSGTLAVTHSPCPAGSFEPRCGPGRSSLSLLTVGDGSDRPLATSTTIAEWPSWSPDGSRIAFVGGTAAGEEMRGGGIYVADADGSGVTRIADTTQRRAPIWSPDGRWLLFQSTDAPDWWLVPADGGGEPRDLGPFGGMAW